MGTRITQDGRENKVFFRFSVLLPMGEKEKTWYSLEVGACFVPFFDWHFSAHMVNSKNKETKLGGIFPWSIFRPSRPAICARAPRTAAAASARPPASLPARPAAASPTRSARTRISKLFLKKCRLFGRHFSCGVSLYKENGKLGYIELTIESWQLQYPFGMNLILFCKNIGFSMYSMYMKTFFHHPCGGFLHCQLSIEINAHFFFRFLPM